VRAGVKAENPAQVTETSDKLDQRLYLAGEPVKDSEQPPVAAPSADHDLIAWQSVEKCGTAACFRAYVEDYPNGRYARMAKARLEPVVESRPAAATTRPAPVARPNQRFTDNDDGTVTDNQTGLVWLKDANCFGQKDWSTAMDLAKRLKNGQCGLRDGSVAGQWRLLSSLEWAESTILRSRLPSGHPFTGVQSSDYWSSNTGSAWNVGSIIYTPAKANTSYVWPVRGGR